MTASPFIRIAALVGLVVLVLLAGNALLVLSLPVAPTAPFYVPECLALPNDNCTPTPSRTPLPTHPPRPP
jgi:hypothetical protein